MPSWRKVITSGSDASLNSLYAPSITGSLLGTASYALYAATASYATNIFISGSISDVDYINFQTGSDQPQAVGRLGWDDGYGTLNLGLKGSNINLAVGQENVVLAFNSEATSLVKGEVVYVSGSQGNRPAVKRAIATSDGYSATTLGIVAETITAGAEGFISTFGMINDLNTLGTTGGAPVWLSPTVSGAWTTTKPTAPGHTVLLGYIVRVHASVGSIFVHISNGWELGELHDVKDTTTTSSYGDLLVKSGSVWINSNQLTGSYAITGSLIATSFTGSLFGTASYATQALSASYAPSTPAFPYTGSANITGSLTLVGSFNVQTYDGANYITAIEVNDNKRNINDILGVSSVNANSRILYDGSSTDSINWDTRILKDALGNDSGQWGTRRLISTNTSRSIDWETRFLHDFSGNITVDWGTMALYDSLGNLSIDWNSRQLLDGLNTVAVIWDAFALNYKVEFLTYLKRFIDSTTQESFSDVPTVAFNYEGEVIQATLDASVNQFDLVYLETDSKWYPVTQGTADCTKLLGICAETGARPKVVLEGSITVNNNSLVDSPYVQFLNYGLPIYIRDSAGIQMSTAVPTTAGQYVRILGHAYYQNINDSQYWTMKFRPSNEWYII